MEMLDDAHVDSFRASAVQNRQAEKIVEIMVKLYEMLLVLRYKGCTSLTARNNFYLVTSSLLEMGSRLKLYARIVYDVNFEWVSIVIQSSGETQPSLAQLGSIASLHKPTGPLHRKRGQEAPAERLEKAQAATPIFKSYSNTLFTQLYVKYLRAILLWGIVLLESQCRV